MVPGKKVTIGGVEYELPPINLATRRQHKDFLARATEWQNGMLPTNDDILAMGDIVYACAKRNYPDLQRDMFEEGMDDAKLLQCFLVILKADGEGPVLGETKPGSP